jgi:choline-sulfatase
VLLYQETVHVPLIVAAPGLTPGRRAEPVSVVDVAPTLLGLAGVTPPPPMAGVDLVRSAPPSDRLLFAATVHGWERYGWAPLQAARQGPIKVIDAPRREVYDLGRDPRETASAGTDHRLFGSVPPSTVEPAATPPPRPCTRDGRRSPRGSCVGS